MPRWANVVLALVAGVLVSPVLLVVAVCVKVVDGGPVLFSQERAGLDGIPFRIWKFRTMVADRAGEGPVVTAGGDRRVTSLGRHLRRLKVDELPQLYNVINGTMSFVGPRPEVPEYAALYSEVEREVLRVRPGLTDPATLRYCNEESLLARQDDPERYYRETLMPEKLRMNLEYVRTRTAMSDLRIIARTVVALFRSAAPRDESL